MTTPTVAPERAALSGADLRVALQSAAKWLSVNAERINALNVFPVPDGDTGTNMSLTLEAAVEGLHRVGEDVPVGQVARSAYEAAMLGARGNSGVILSQLLRGFSEALADCAELTPTGLAQALTRASEVAYRGISRPIEGTILTVAREAAAAATDQARSGADLTSVLERTLAAAAVAVAATPSQLDVLRKAGVVDSGGEGYRVMLEGAWMWLTGRPIDSDAAASQNAYARASVESVDEHATFGFCTEFLLRDCDLALAEVKGRMESLGDSVITVGDSELMRVHVHTPRPGQALEFAVDHGTLAKVKVENMQLQHQAFAAAAGPGASDGDAQLTGSIGVVAVAAGEGFQKVFRSLGARVVNGGQTMNPSVQDILAAVNSSGHRELLILPNNSNIVHTARQAQQLTTHKVAVIPTETAPQGSGALLAFNFQSDMQTNAAAMEQAAHAVHTIEVTRAMRDADVDRVSVSAGEMLGIYNGRVVVSRPSADEALLGALAQAPVESMEIVTIYYGYGASEEQARAVAARIRAEHPGLDVEVVEGGQPHYPYVVSLE